MGNRKAKDFIKGLEKLPKKYQKGACMGIILGSGATPEERSEAIANALNQPPSEYNNGFADGLAASHASHIKI